MTFSMKTLVCNFHDEVSSNHISRVSYCAAKHHAEYHAKDLQQRKHSLATSTRGFHRKISNGGSVWLKLLKKRNQCHWLQMTFHVFFKDGYQQNMCVSLAELLFFFLNRQVCLKKGPCCWLMVLNSYERLITHSWLLNFIF